MSVTAARRRPRLLGSRLDRLTEGRFAIVALSPGLLLVGLVVLPPVLAVLGLSLFRIELIRDDLRPFVGLSNFVNRLPADTTFVGTIPRTILFAAAATALSVPVALGAALLVNGRGRSANLLGLLLLLPWAVAPIAAGLFWRYVFDTRYGLVNDALVGLGLTPVPWTNDALPMLVVTLVATVWRSTPLLAVLLLGSLRAVPPSLARAGRMDGASSWQILRHITLPAIRPTLIVVIVIELVLSLQVFDILFGIGQGHPQPGATLTTFAIYDSVIGSLSFGYGSAQTVALAALIALCLVPLALVVRSSTRRDRAGAVAGEPDTTILSAAPPTSAVRPAPGPVVRPAATLSEWPGADTPEPPRRFRPGLRVRQFGRAMGIFLLVAWLVGPIVWLLIASTQPERALRSVPPALTTNLTLDGYTRLLTDPTWSGALAVSIAVALGATVLALAGGILAGYPLARIRFRGSQLILAVLLITQLIPPIALAIPILMLFIAFGLRGTVPGLIVVNAAFWTPILIWLIRAAFLAVPRSIESAARIDGAGRLATVLRISLPAAAPALAAAAVIVFVGVWNDFVFVASIGTRTTSTLPRYLTVVPDPPYHVLAAGILLTIVPCLVLVAAMHRRILRAV